MTAWSPTSFFEQQLPRLFAERAARPGREADVVFEIVGPAGGRWNLHLAAQPQVTAVDPWFQGQLLVRMEQALFAAFCDGDLDVAGAVRAGQLAIAGDASLLDELAVMWHEPLSPLGVRTGGGE